MSSKLTVIAEQVRFLQRQAQEIMEEAQMNARLHHAACNFQKVPGSTYYLYRRSNDQEYFSMIKPEVGLSLPSRHVENGVQMARGASKCVVMNRAKRPVFLQ